MSAFFRLRRSMERSTRRRVGRRRGISVRVCGAHGLSGNAPVSGPASGRPRVAGISKGYICIMGRERWDIQKGGIRRGLSQSLWFQARRDEGGVTPLAVLLDWGQRELVGLAKGTSGPTNVTQVDCHEVRINQPGHNVRRPSGTYHRSYHSRT